MRYLLLTGSPTVQELLYPLTCMNHVYCKNIIIVLQLYSFFKIISYFEFSVLSASLFSVVLIFSEMSSQYFELITQMIMILSLACICLALWSQLLTLRIPNSKSQISIGGRWLCTSLENPMKREFEIYVLLYSFFWISVFAVVIIQKWYEAFEAKHYFMLCSSLAMPLLLQPIIFPMPTEARLPIYLRYSFKANIWIACYSFIGNYWYTHYFYNVLQAKYTFPSHRLNDVPIALYFATHFYFMTYHTLSNMILRKLTTRYTAGNKLF